MTKTVCDNCGKEIKMNVHKIVLTSSVAFGFTVESYGTDALQRLEFCGPLCMGTYLKEKYEH